MKKKRFKIEYGIYPFSCMVFIGYTNVEIEDYLKRYYGVELNEEEQVAIMMEEQGRGRTVMLDMGGTILRLAELDKNNPSHIATLSHEVFHAVEFLFDRIGITLSRDSDEAFAYMIEYLTKQILIKAK